MGWAGALEGIFEIYAADFNAKPLNLYQNFRSAPRLRRMQNAMVRVMDPPAALDDDELQGDDGEIEILSFDNATEEATHLANVISGWIENEVIDPSEIAVLVSKQQNLYCQELRAALTAQRVPFREEDQAQDLASERIVGCWKPSFTTKASTTSRNTADALDGTGSLPMFVNGFRQPG
jgi:superfamily I DNA/RNA helicase